MICLPPRPISARPTSDARAFSILAALAILWAACLLWFLQSLPDAQLPTTVKTDAIIVLTGGNGRVEHGFAVLAEGAAPVLFISGVGQHATLPQILLAHASPEVRSKIVMLQPEIILDHVAETTQSNATEAATFVAQHHIQSIRLITANYHMPRSLLEFKTAIPGVTLVPDPVFPDGFRRNEWWKHDPTRRLVFSEFNKYFAALFLRRLQQN